LPRGFAFPQRVDVFRAVTGFNAEAARRYSAVARLRLGVTMADVQAELDALGRQYEQAHPTTNRGVRFHVRSLRDSYVGPVRPYVWLLAGAVGLVLLISGANVINLYLVRAVGRRHEVAIRRALGAERWRIVLAFVTESVLLASVGGTLGVTLASVVLALLPRFTALDLPPWMATRVDLPVLLFAAGLSLAIGLVTGAAAAIGAVNANSPDALRSNTRGSTGGARQRRTRATLMTAQVALAVAVLLGAGLTMKSFARLRAVDLGLRPEHLITFRVDPPWKKYPELSDISLFYERTLERLGTLPGVTGVAANHKLPLSGLSDLTQTVTIEGQERAQAMPFVNVQYITPAYFSVMGIGLDAGRPFVHADRESDQRVAIVSQSAAARFWPGTDPVGQRIFLNVRTRGFGANNNADMWVTIVGVVRDVRSTDPVLAPDLDLYLPIFQAYAGDTFFVVRAASVAGVRSSLVAAVLNVDPEQSIFDIASMDERIGARVWQRRAAAAVMTIFAATTLVLVAVGIFALVSFAVAEQTREIGVRVALGARAGDVRRLVFTQALVPVAIGVALGLPVALVATRTLTAVLFSVSPVDPAVAVSVTMVVGVAAVVACAIPARRATHVDPVVVLRQ
jgi:putative ABC transport system permease protein